MPVPITFAPSLPDDVGTTTTAARAAANAEYVTQSFAIDASASCMMPNSTHKNGMITITNSAMIEPRARPRVL